MRPVFNAAQMRRADEMMQVEYGYLGILLMETAGRRASSFVLKHYPDTKRFIIISGPGNNGGDGLVIARYLHQRGKQLFVLISRPPEKLSALARIQYDILTRLGVICHILSPDNLRLLAAFVQEGPDKPIIIDALVGIGLQQALRDREASLIEFLRGLKLPAVAIDLPSGLSGDTGQVYSEPLTCERTITFEVPKICHVVWPAARYCGQVHVVRIGIYPEVLDRVGATTYLLTRKGIASLLPPRPLDGHKGSFGHVLVVGGSVGKGGAPALATVAALRSGAGLASALIPGASADSFHRKTLSGMSLPYGDRHTGFLNHIAALWAASHLEGKAAIVLGPGLGHTPETTGFLQKFLDLVQDLPLVLDADALNILAQEDSLRAKLPPHTILTPHPGEAARLLRTSSDRIQAYRLESALHIAQRYQAITILKGAYPLIATPKGEIYFLPTSEPALATAGSGDVLAGLIGGFLAQGLTPLAATQISLYLHLKAARLAQKSLAGPTLTAAILLKAIGKAYKQLTTSLP